MTGWRTRLALLGLGRALRRRGVGRHERRAILADVHANLHAAAADFGEREALRRIGRLDALADAYANGRDVRRPSVGAGLTAVAIALLALLALTLVRVPTFGLVDEFDRHTGATTWNWEVWRLWRFGGDARTDTLFEGTVYSYAFILVPLLVFAVWSRPWRLARPRLQGGPAVRTR